MFDTFSTIDASIDWSIKHRPYLNQYQVSTLPDTHCDVFLVLRNAQYYIVMDWSYRGIERIAADTYLITQTGLVPVWDTITGIPQYWSPLTSVFMRHVHPRVLMLVMDAQTRLGPISLLCHYVAQSDPEPLDGNKYTTPLKRMGPKPGSKYRSRLNYRLPDIL